MNEFTGKINAIVFESDKDLFKIVDVTIMGQLAGYSRDEIKVTGSLGDVQVEETYHFSGNLVMHNKFGLQFKVDSYKHVFPNEEEGLIGYLSSAKFPGIGKKTAAKIVSELGLDVLNILQKRPDKIAVLGLSSKQKQGLLTGLNSLDSYSDLVLKMAQLGINKRIAGKLYQKYHGDTYQKLQTDPYAPIVEVTGYGFKTADKLGQRLEIDPEDARRIKGAIFQVLLDALTKDGDTYIDLEVLLPKVAKILNIAEFDPIASCINDLQHVGKVTVDDDHAALQSISQTETDIALLLKNLIKRGQEQNKKPYNEKEVAKAIKQAEKELNIAYDDTQKEAIKNAITQPISVLTGGPGTGKTTIINGIILSLKILSKIPSAALYSSDPPFLLAAPTGRAAKRMEEISGINAKTIHRLLGLGIGENSAEDLNELNGEILIIDEMSMVDMFLFEQLLSSISQTKHIVFVGDKDQLPSVNAGNVFSNLISSKVFPTTILEKIHRQGENSTIISLAHEINQGLETNLFKKTKNYSFISCQQNMVSEAVAQIVELTLKHGFSKDDIQVLGAMYNGDGGVVNLNNVIQNIMNPAKENSKKLITHNETFRIGDRVLQLQNNPEKDIYNGQIGKVVGIDEDNAKKCLTADFDDREINFSKKDLLDLTRAYAITIHKAQGSEFPIVILNLTMQNYVMLKKNLLYTAVTRAEKNLILIGEPKAYLMALKVSGNNRKTDLVRKLHKQLGLVSKKDKDSKESEVFNEKGSKKDFILSPELIYSGQIDPMIGMSQIKLTARK